jgi:hypothetical protein
MENLVWAIWGVALMGLVGAVIGTWINTASEKAQSDAYYRPRIEAEREAKERRRMDEFLNH